MTTRERRCGSAGLLRCDRFGIELGQSVVLVTAVAVHRVRVVPGTSGRRVTRILRKGSFQYAQTSGEP
ncbi:MAG: hypothetical protein M3Y77_02700, partial [Actinomycetota bacterium]|nr:hypothetical protein [Actinomycetota bacterium]